MTAGPVFLDTGIFIAFLDRSDRHHVFLGALSIGEVWETDRDLALEGARVIPVSR